MSDRRTVLALVLMGLVLLVTPTYMRWVSGPVPEAPGITGNRAEELSPERQIQPEVPPPIPSIEAPPPMTEPAARIEQIITVVTPNYTASFSTLGASLRRWDLSRYRTGQEGVVHLMPEGAQALTAQIPDGDYRVSTEELTFSTDAPDTIWIQAGEEVPLRLETAWPGGRAMVREIVISGDSYDLEIRDTIEGVVVNPVNDIYRLWWEGGLSFTEPDRKEELSFSGFHAQQAKDVHKTKLKSTPVESQLTGQVSWAALRTKYFAAIMMRAERSFDGASMTGVAGETGPAAMNMGVDVRLENIPRNEIWTRLYLGPIDYKILRSYDRDLTRMMDLGWGFIRPISKVILNLFTFLYAYIPNYGLVIILFSVLVKIVVYPLTKKSYESMHAMQELAPKMTEIREKYKDDPEKMNKKMMNLYKEHKVNPLGGCFPILLQMPIFFSLFVVFRSTIELRGAPFFGWLQDLSLRDPYLILPLLMSLTMFIQQRAQLKDPRQKLLVYMMPVLMFFLFKGFPAGLVLYWTLFNILSVIQTEWLQPRKPAVQGTT